MRQVRYNEEHGITPGTIVKAIQKKIVPGQVEDGKKLAAAVEGMGRAEVMDMVMELEGEMHAAAEMKKVYGVHYPNKSSMSLWFVNKCNKWWPKTY